MKKRLINHVIAIIGIAVLASCATGKVTITDIPREHIGKRIELYVDKSHTTMSIRDSNFDIMFLTNDPHYPGNSTLDVKIIFDGTTYIVRSVKFENNTAVVRWNRLTNNPPLAQAAPSPAPAPSPVQTAPAPSPAQAAPAPDIPAAQGNNLTEKLDWLRVFAQSNNSYLIEVNADERIPAQTLEFSGKRNITLTLWGRGANRTLNNNFTVGSGVTLILDNNITIRGARVNVNSGGTLIMNNGSTITGNNSGSGVYVNGGTFTMSGGKITDNTRSSSSGSNGGVYVSSGTFTMTGGEITGNSVRGIYVKGTFAMSGGTISGNTNSNRDGETSYGGGVYVEGTFTMSGGKISGNTASAGNISTTYAYSSGGGVYVLGTFTMNNGEISGNTVAINSRDGSRSGGGVSVYGTFTMNGGTISGNTAREDGGGVYMTSGTFTMSGGTISGNTASNGGGVYTWNETAFTMSNGTISGNTANSSGGGVYVFSGSISGNFRRGTFTMSGGTISGNTARENGGGIYIPAGGIFTKTGGTITGYTSDQRNGNAVKNSSGAVQNYRGHAVWAGTTETLLKIKESTAGPGDNLAYNSRTNPPTTSGAWDN